MKDPSPRLATLLQGAGIPGDSGHPTSPPKWLDIQLFNEGRNFYQNYLFCLCFSELMSLLLVLSQGHVLKPLLHTGRSDTPSRARRRYISTLLHLITWFEGDVWDPTGLAYKDILSIRNTHCRIGESFNSPEEYKKVLQDNIHSRGHEKVKNPIIPSLQKDMKVLHPLEGEKDACPIFLSQLDMSLTQYSFMGLILAHPTHLGAGGASPREMEGFIHFWRGVGYLLGIKDEYNFCSGTLKDVRSLCLEVEQRILLPRLATASYDYEHMVHALMTGIGQILPVISLPAMLKYLTYIFQIPTMSYTATMSFKHILHYYVMRGTFACILWYPRVLRYLNLWFKKIIRKVEVKDRIGLRSYRRRQAELTVSKDAGGCERPVGLDSVCL